MDADGREVSVREVQLTQEVVVLDRVHGVALTSSDVGDGRDVLGLEATLVVIADDSFDISGSQARDLQYVLQLAKAVRPDVNALVLRPVTQDA